MKPSHRKDVIIARIIFAFMCLALVVIIAAVIMTVSSHRKAAKLEAELQQLQEETKQQEEQAEQPNQVDQSTEDFGYVVTPPEEEPVMEVYVRATANVNLRTEASTESEVILTIDSGTEMVLVSEENGWALVSYDGQTGYVSADFIENVEAEEQAN